MPPRLRVFVTPAKSVGMAFRSQLLRSVFFLVSLFYFFFFFITSPGLADCYCLCLGNGIAVYRIEARSGWYEARGFLRAVVRGGGLRGNQICG